MRQFSKQCDKATEYSTELQDNFIARGLDHPAYPSGAFRSSYYRDVYFNLLKEQGGLCAYSEKRLCRNDVLVDDHWADGKCTLTGQIKIDGDIDHFDPTLKAKQGWLWDNLFLVRTFINRKIKLEYPVDSRYKPDTVMYSPDNFFSYDLSKHEYVPKEDLSPDLTEEVRYTIEKLGINAESTITDRRACLSKIQSDLEYGSKTAAEIIIDEFPTAIRLSKILE